MAEAVVNFDLTAEERSWFQNCQLYDEMDEATEVKSADTVRKLSESERKNYVGQTAVRADDTYKKVLLEESHQMFGVMGSDEEEHMVIRHEDGLLEVKMECAIMMEPLPPFQIIQYQFEDSVWRLSKIGAMACENYRKGKFKHWEEMIKKPVCEASLRRMVEIGLITTLFDHLAFPNPPETEGDYETINDETGKKVLIPHPIQALRVWDSAKREYKSQNGRLEGAPEPSEEEGYWTVLLTDLREKFPEEMERIEKGVKPKI